MSKNNAFNRYPAVIHGEARAENDEFIVYTRYPRFLARKSFSDDYVGLLPSHGVSGDLVQDVATGRLVYRSNVGVFLSDFIFLDANRPELTAEWQESLKAACARVVADDVMLAEDGDLYD